MNAERICRNCRAPLRGEYCHICGQREGRPDLMFTEAVGETVGDLFAWDSRFWRTLLPLLLRPGFLTAEFIAGRRARYVPPFRLYLIISFILFLVLSLDASNSLDIAIGDEVADSPEAEPSAQLLERPGTPEDSSEDAAGAATNDRVIDLGIDPNDPDTPTWLADMVRRMETNAERVGEDPRLFLDPLLERLPQIMFFMLPLFALLLLICYAFSPFHYLQHLVFGLHYHSYVYLLYLLGSLLELVGFEADTLLFFVLVAYLPLALRRTYESSIPGVLLRSLFIYISYFLLLVMGFAALSLVVVALL